MSIDSEFVQRADSAVYETDEPVLYAVVEGVASVTLNRPTVNNAQNSQMTYALDDAFRRAVNGESVPGSVAPHCSKYTSSSTGRRGSQPAFSSSGLSLKWLT